jgi:hypothetical protein
VEFTFQVQNITHKPATITLEATPQLEFPRALPGNEEYVMLPGDRIFAFDRWTDELGVKQIALEPTDCAEDVTLTLVVNDDATPVDGALFTVPAIATTEDGEIVPLDGITAYGHTPCPDSWGGDADGDAICGDLDNCPSINNPEQMDSDGDGIGDFCDEDPYRGQAEPCQNKEEAGLYAAAYSCLDKIRTEKLAPAVRLGTELSRVADSASEVAYREASAATLDGIMAAKLGQVQQSLCRQQVSSSLTRLEAMQYQVTVLERIGQLTADGAQALRLAYADCATEIRDAAP